MRALLLLPRLMVLTPPRPCARLARLCTTPMAQFDQSFGAQPPSEKQFEYAQSLALQTATAMPPEAHTDRTVCSTFIDDCRGKMSPSTKQLAFAEKLAEGSGVALPPDAQVNMVVCSEFIDQQLALQNGGVPGAAGGAMGGAPSEKQLLYAISLAQKANLGLTADILADKRACSTFIDSQACSHPLRPPASLLHSLFPLLPCAAAHSCAPFEPTRSPVGHGWRRIGASRLRSGAGRLRSGAGRRSAGPGLAAGRILGRRRATGSAGGAGGAVPRGGDSFLSGERPAAAAPARSGGCDVYMLPVGCLRFSKGAVHISDVFRWSCRRVYACFRFVYLTSSSARLVLSTLSFPRCLGFLALP